VIESFDPEAIVFQSGADSLVGDKLGCFNLSIRGHGECLKFMKTFNLPLILLGGGGYTMRNVARCWAYETAVVLGKEDQLADALPPHAYYEYYGKDYRLHYDRDLEPARARPDRNDRARLEEIRGRVFERLATLGAPPSVPVQERPEDALNPSVKEEDPDVRPRMWDASLGVDEDGDGREDKPARHEGAAAGGAGGGGGGDEVQGENGGPGAAEGMETDG